VEVATRLGCDDFNKVEFLNAIQLIRRKTFTETTIKASFREAGLYPLNPDLVTVRAFGDTKVDSSILVVP
jgi:hypothetical protein